ncbi:hypothetical protein RvY_08873 [Ramazzottius varieornatus]|uniref:Fructose-2,6-bisphosphatase TIGAR n=1 Tax=Ramazzottius varieornatus TaxID=947166 RepID=A0A1D1V7C6_RAMVA|nr:hypothetical protein RvY_08873 [Ramazzottius varieornatus]
MAGPAHSLALTGRTQFEIPFCFGISFIRHGESVGNKLGVVQGHKDYPLSTLGIAQSQHLGHNSVTNLRVSHVFSSDLSRSLKTAEIVCSCLGNAPPIVLDQRLRERSFGELEGQRLDQFRIELRNSGVHMSEFKPPGGETTADVRARAAAFLEDLFNGLKKFEKEREAAVKADKPGYFMEYQVPCGTSYSPTPGSPNEILTASVLIFAHGGWIREALIYLEQKYHICTEAQRSQITAVAPCGGVSTLTFKMTDSKTTGNCLWLHSVYHVSDSQRPRTSKIAALARSRSAQARKPFASQFSSPV